MRLNWFTPLPPAKTEIAQHVIRLLPALSKVADVTLWTDQSVVDRQLQKSARVRNYRYPRLPWAELNHADMTFFEMGNNPDFHGGIWQVSRQLAGVVILHDFRLHHFFDGMYRVKFRDRNSYLALMDKYYGSEGRRDAVICFQTNGKNIDYMADRYPLTQFALENAVGALVHNREVYESLIPTTAQPLGYAGLPFPSDWNKSRASRVASDGPRRLVLFGYIGRNRRLHSILRALSELEEKNQFRLDIFGQILEDEKGLRASIASLKLNGIVRLRGFTEEAELDKALSEADLAINLRYPTMGEASASQLRIWAHSLPSMVTRVGWYASIPEEVVAFVRHDEHEVDDIRDHLRSLLLQPERYAEMGRKGYLRLQEEHAPEAYAQAVIDLTARAISFRSEAAGLRLAERAARETTAWLPEENREETFRRIAQEVYALAKRS